jgi:glycosyltransferase involved in cell wall biosynthesis
MSPFRSDRTRDPLVTIVIPFLNTPCGFLREAVESIWGQTVDRWELLLVDDGSTDESATYARDLAASHPDRVRYLDHPNHENRGVSASRMIGVSGARGRYVAFLDADDVWFPSKLEQQLALIEANPQAAMIYGNSQYWYSWTSGGADLRHDFVPQIGVRGVALVPPPRLLPLYLRGLAAVPCPCSVLVKRTAFEQIGGFEAEFRSMYEDQVFYAKICLAAPVLVANVCWSRYRQHPDSMCAAADRSGLEQAARLTFLRWLERYLLGQGVADRHVWAALREELARCDPTGELRVGRTAMVKRRMHKFVARIRGHAL